MKKLTYPNTLFIGLGGTGGRVLKELRLQLYDKQGEIPSGIGFMYVDASDELMRYGDPTWTTANGYDAQFPLMDFLNIGGMAGKATHDDLSAASQDRRLGRIRMGVHGATFSDMLCSLCP